MPEFTVHIDSFSGVAGDEEDLLRLADALNDLPVGAPALSIDTVEGSIGATFQVEAAGLDEAVHDAVEAFGDALGRAGLGRRTKDGDLAVGGRLMIEESDLVESLVGRVTVEREALAV